MYSAPRRPDQLPTRSVNPTDPTDPTDPADPAGCTSPAWDAGTVYNGGAAVSHDGIEYTAKWWTQGETPGTHDVWASAGPCAVDPTDPTNPPDPTDPVCTDAWSSSTAYTAGDQVSYQGTNYQAKWWSQGEIPSSSEGGAWESMASCG